MTTAIKKAFKRLTTKSDINANGHPIIEVHPLTDEPTEAWEILRVNQPVTIVGPMNLETPIFEDKVRFVCLSDTHSRPLDKLLIPNGDVLLIAGDFTNCGRRKEIIAFNELLATFPHRHKVVICGNHELTFDTKTNVGTEFPCSDSEGESFNNAMQDNVPQPGVSDPRKLLTNCFYLEDSMVTLFGLKIYGSPWQPVFGGWAFNLPRGQQLLDKWNLIPSDVDVLMTHGPPLGHGDLTRTKLRAGCLELLNSIRHRIHPKFHVFGHIHEGYGCTTDGYTTFINACTCNIKYNPINLPVIFDIELPSGETK